MPPLRLSIFIDGGYLFHVFNPYRNRGFKYSLKRMVRLLATDYVLQRVYYVDAINERDANTKKKQEAFFYGVLRDQLGYEVLIRPLQFPGGQPTQKGTDTSLFCWPRILTLFQPSNWSRNNRRWFGTLIFEFARHSI
jgi:hypothetical protein